uniref:Uncharacterized protein n=1 Tax=Zea mays TaxID=4577 RepID=B4FL03_MAIZE|nr:unknown [Zea mays]
MRAGPGDEEGLPCAGEAAGRRGGGWRGQARRRRQEGQEGQESKQAEGQRRLRGPGREAGVAGAREPARARRRLPVLRGAPGAELLQRGAPGAELLQRGAPELERGVLRARGRGAVRRVPAHGAGGVHVRPAGHAGV